ncbi:MAG: RtcB family protein [Saprospiraceae bacterium]
MGKLKLRGKDLRGLPFPDSRSLSIAVNIARQYFKRGVKAEVLDLFAQVLENPGKFKDDERFQKLIEALDTPPPQTEKERSFQSLAAAPKPYNAYGLECIEPGAIEQMETAMRLPITVAGALMPDAHQGYGLPIGGVLAADNAVIPYGVGVDIGCRMCLSVFDLDPGFLTKHREKLGKTLLENTAFGLQEVDRPMDDPIFERSEFSEIPILKELKHKASRQIGSSGSGNHFVEFGIVVIREENNPWGVQPGEYLGLLSHSGSRNLGANVARHYTRLARALCKLPKGAQHLAWLDLDTQEGQEYWKAMTLAGDYASACHHHIHRRIARALAEQPMMMVENHHNFAWKEKLPDGKEVVVHRKGATPAKKGDLGIIPGSMIHPGFIVRGKGATSSLQSASHGAGRQMSRTQTAKSITRHALDKILAEHGVQLMGGGLDEAPIAYKDIHQVMEFQKDLVDVLGLFYPKIVRMDK